MQKGLKTDFGGVEAQFERWCAKSDQRWEVYYEVC